ncbi:uncharacterized protein LOC119402728 [Rhipicephalus sanguineus]|uniref:uncharacterized protein LOC119402728 n=1 Tax=Rhipicephalus sanguineus TaxID=34632 RepID=UPI0020C38844|nr:uncharacterized protein LOC119402728 [Rhipicephalus sanguineus]
MSVILRTRGVVDNRTAAELYAQRLHHRVRAIGDPGSVGPGRPTGPEPDILTPRWRLLTGAGLGVGADAVIAILPHYDARNYPWEHIARVVVAVAFAACGIDGIDGLVAKIFGPNQPRTAHFPSVSSCLSRYGTPGTWMLAIVLSFVAKAIMTASWPSKRSRLCQSRGQSPPCRHRRRGRFG